MEHKLVQAFDGPSGLGSAAQYEGVSASHSSWFGDTGIEATHLELVQYFQDLGHTHASPDGPASLRGLCHADDGLTNLEMISDINMLLADARRY